MEEIGVLDIDTRPPPAPSGTATDAAFRDFPIDGGTRLEDIRTKDIAKSILGPGTVSTVSSYSTTFGGSTLSATAAATTYSNLSGASVWCIVVGSTVGILLMVVAAVFCLGHRKRESSKGRHTAQPLGRRTVADK
jgi:hypothetical protein